MLIEEYSRLDLTRESDRLPILSGIIEQQIRRYLTRVFLEGFPQRLYQSPSIVDYQLNRCLDTYYALSFSQTSLEGPINYYIKAQKLGSVSGHDLTTIIDQSCTPKGLDPQGCVLDRHLELYGQIRAVTVTDLCILPITSTYSILTNNQYYKFILNILLMLCKVELVEVNIRDLVTLLLLESIKRRNIDLLYTSIAIALQLSKRVPSAFKRIGLIQDNKPYIYNSESLDIFRATPKWFDYKENIKIV